MEQSDLNNYKMLTQIILSGDYKLKGDAIVQVASLLRWFDMFEIKIKASIKTEPSVKPLKGAK